jgi:hypothetical protein
VYLCALGWEIPLVTFYFPQNLWYMVQLFDTYPILQSLIGEFLLVQGLAENTRNTLEYFNKFL